MPPSIPPSAGTLAAAPAAIMLDVAMAEVVAPVTAIYVEAMAAEDVAFFPVPLLLVFADAVPVAEPEALVLVPDAVLLLLSMAEVVV